MRDWQTGAIYRKAVIPTDNSELCHAGIDWGVAFARKWGTVLVGNHVYAARLHDDRFRQLETGLPARFQTEKEVKRQRNIHDKLIETGLILISDSFLDVLDNRGEENDLEIERKLMEGIHFEQLAKDINSSDYDLVIMGAHGIGQVKRSEIGMVTARVARLITTDMLIMREADRTLTDGKILVCVDGSAYCFVALRKALRGWLRSSAQPCMRLRPSILSITTRPSTTSATCYLIRPAKYSSSKSRKSCTTTSSIGVSKLCARRI